MNTNQEAAKPSSKERHTDQLARALEKVIHIFDIPGFKDYTLSEQLKAMHQKLSSVEITGEVLFILPDNNDALFAKEVFWQLLHYYSPNATRKSHYVNHTQQLGDHADCAVQQRPEMIVVLDHGLDKALFDTYAELTDTLLVFTNDQSAWGEHNNVVKKTAWATSLMVAGLYMLAAEERDRYLHRRMVKIGAVLIHAAEGHGVQENSLVLPDHVEDAMAVLLHDKSRTIPWKNYLGPTGNTPALQFKRHCGYTLFVGMLSRYVYEQKCEFLVAQRNFAEKATVVEKIVQCGEEKRRLRVAVLPSDFCTLTTLRRLVEDSSSVTADVDAVAVHGLVKMSTGQRVMQTTVLAISLQNAWDIFPGNLHRAPSQEIVFYRDPGDFFAAITTGI